MKCKDCNCCRLGFFTYKPNDYVCTGVPEPFVISDINVECTEYGHKMYESSYLPCPFCGGKPVLQNSKLNFYEKCNIDTDSDHWWSVFCDDCFAEGPEKLSKEAERNGFLDNQAYADALIQQKGFNSQDVLDALNKYLYEDNWSFSFFEMDSKDADKVGRMMK